MKKKLIFKILLLIVSNLLFSQEALKSIEEEYYDFLSLDGTIERPTLSYRTLSDSEWYIPDNKEHIWQNNNLGNTNILFESTNQGTNWFTKGFYHGLKYKIYGPEWYNSYNTKNPYGQNDGALWQGKGYNTSFSVGARLEGYGFELTLKPQFTFSQNLEFEIMPSNYDSEFGYYWGYRHNIGVDLPQRFGKKSFTKFNLFESEIRYSWKKFTFGLGYQPIWLGPAYLNPILHSNHSVPYPKFDIGIRKTKVFIPFTDLFIGEIESRIWLGYLSESKFFDNIDSNNHNFISGFNFSYSPSFLKGFTLTLNKICLSKWEKDSIKYLNPFYNKNNYKQGDLGEDQKISISMNWLIPKGGIEIFGELAIDDKSNRHLSPYALLTQFWHTSAYLAGIKKKININQHYSLEIVFEWYNSEMSQDMQVQWYYSFGFHNLITQGYTNEGQYLGSGAGYGGQGQYLGIKLFYQKGYTNLFFYRNQPDNDYLFKESIYDSASESDLHNRTWSCYKTNFSIGIESLYFVDNLIINPGIVYTLVINPLYKSNPRYDTWHNFTFIFSLKYNFN